MEVQLAHDVTAVTLLELAEVDVVIPVGRREVEISDSVPQHQMTAAPLNRFEEQRAHAENL
jgi:hypothetical protein